MRPGPTIIQECPNCDQPIKNHTLMSGNTFGARYWTDAKQEAPMFPDQPWLVKCPACEALFWLDEAKELAEIDAFAGGDERLTNARNYETPAEAEYLDFLSETQLAPKKERYVRTRSWWLANDRHRVSQAPCSEFTDDQLVNLGRLSDLLDEAEPDARLMKAELARELGLFGEAMLLLDTPFPDEFSLVVETIRSLCEETRTAVVEIGCEE